MESKRFIDTSGFYSLMVKRDDMYNRAKGILEQGAKERVIFVTTDYVLDETATLFRARGLSCLLSSLFNVVIESKACRIEWMDQDRFFKTRVMFFKFSDHSWSFTDCFSFVVMKELRLSEAVTKDDHFREAGFLPLLAS